jgi:Protein of unknown function (DUF2829)
MSDTVLNVEIDNIVAFESCNLDFGYALAALKNGAKVARAGWNGKDMFLIMAGGYSVEKDKLRAGTHMTKEFLESEGAESLNIMLHIDMWTAQKTYLTGWVPSQMDMFATDWKIVK